MTTLSYVCYNCYTSLEHNLTSIASSPRHKRVTRLRASRQAGRPAGRRADGPSCASPLPLLIFVFLSASLSLSPLCLSPPLSSSRLLLLSPLLGSSRLLSPPLASSRSAERPSCEGYTIISATYASEIHQQSVISPFPVQVLFFVSG